MPAQAKQFHTQHKHKYTVLPRALPHNSRKIQGKEDSTLTAMSKAATRLQHTCDWSWWLKVKVISLYNLINQDEYMFNESRAVWHNKITKSNQFVNILWCEVIWNYMKHFFFVLFTSKENIRIIRQSKWILNFILGIILNSGLFVYPMDKLCLVLNINLFIIIYRKKFKCLQCRILWIHN